MNPFAKLFAKTLPPPARDGAGLIYNSGSLNYDYPTSGGLAQRLEYPISNREVYGSTPSRRNPPRDNDGRYLPHRIAVRRRAIEMAYDLGRADLVIKLRDTSC